MAKLNSNHSGGAMKRCSRVAILALALVVVIVPAAHATYEDTFNSSPFSGQVTSFTTGTSSTGMSYSMSGGDFAWVSIGGDGNSGTIDILSSAFDPATERVTIESRDDKAFVFNSLWIDVLGDGVSIRGYGPEPFSITASTGSSGTESPSGGAKLVTSVEITSTDFYDDYLDTVSVELDVPGAGIYGAGNLIVNGDSTPSVSDATDMGTTPVGVPVTKTFTIESIGDVALDLTGSPYVTISGSADFTISAQPTTDPIASGGSDTFIVQCNPTAVGARTAVVSVSNDSEASPYTFNVECTGEQDTTKPDVTINQAGGQADPTNGSPVNFTAVFSEAVTGFVTGDVTLGGTAGATTGAVTEIAPNDGTTYNVAVSGMASDGTIIATIAAGVAQDAASNTNNASTSTDNTVTYDATDPTDPTPSSSSHVVSVWDNDNAVDIEISGASDAGTGVDGFEIEWDQSATWTPTETKEQEETWSGATFTATSDGDWYFHIATVDNAGNWTSTQHLGPFQIDTADPSVPTGLDPASGSYTSDTSPLLSWVASTDAGSGIRTSDAYRIVVTGPVNRDTYVSDTDYNPTLSEGTFSWKLYARDNAGNSSAYTAGTTLIIDATGPDVTINQAGGQADPTNASPIAFTVVFDEPIDDTTFTSNDVSVVGPGTVGAVTEIAPNDDTTFEVSLVTTGDGTVTVTIPAGGIEDFAGNTNTVSTSTDNSVTYDGSRPSVTINEAAAQGDPTNAFPITYTVVFDEPINVGTFTADDVSVGGSYLVAQATGISEMAPNDGTTFSVTVDAVVHLNDGTIIATILAGSVEDPFGNTNYSSTSTDNTVTMDTDAPGIVSVTPNAAFDADVGVVSVSITFDEPMDTGTNPSPTITGLATDPYTITGSAWSNGDQTWTGTFTFVDDNELATGDYNVSGFKDVAGNTMIANSSKSIEVDTENPSVIAVDDTDVVIADNDHGGLFTITVRFDESMDTAVAPTLEFDPDVTSGASITLIAGSTGWSQTTVADDTYTIEYLMRDADVDEDAVLVDVTGAQDRNGNLQANYAPANEFNIDTLNPTVTSIAVSDTLIDGRDIGIAAYTITVSYSEAMTTDGSADPVLTFSPALGTTLLPSSGTWVSATTYEAVYDVLDANVVEPGIDIHVTGGEDAVGNSQVDFDGVDRFDVDTLNPPPGAVADITVEPMGSAGPETFLDRCLDLAEGEAPPMVGECPLSAIYEVGELVTGACNVCDPAGRTVRGSFVRLYVYAVDIDARPEEVTLLDHWAVHYGSERGCYAFSWDTTDQAPGYYDLHFFFADWTTHTCRIQLVAPAEE